jgi:hypothetical protein
MDERLGLEVFWCLPGSTEPHDGVFRDTNEVITGLEWKRMDLYSSSSSS